MTDTMKVLDMIKDEHEAYEEYMGMKEFYRHEADEYHDMATKATSPAQQQEAMRCYNKYTHMADTYEEMCKDEKDHCHALKSMYAEDLENIEHQLQEYLRMIEDLEHKNPK